MVCCTPCFFFYCSCFISALWHFPLSSRLSLRQDEDYTGQDSHFTPQFRTYCRLNTIVLTELQKCRYNTLQYSIVVDGCWCASLAKHPACRSCKAQLMRTLLGSCRSRVLYNCRIPYPFSLQTVGLVTDSSTLLLYRVFKMRYHFSIHFRENKVYTVQVDTVSLKSLFDIRSN